MGSGGVFSHTLVLGLGLALRTVNNGLGLDLIGQGLCLIGHGLDLGFNHRRFDFACTRFTFLF